MMRKYGLLLAAIFFIPGFILCTPAPAPGAESIDSDHESSTREYNLDDLIAACLQHNIDIKAAAEKVSGQLARVRQAKGKRLPGATFSGVYTHLGVVPHFEMPGFEDIKFVYPEMLNFTAALEYNLFDWGITETGIQIEKLGLESQRLGADLLEKNFILQLSILYYNILQAEENEEVIGENIALLNEILALLREQFRGGIIPEHQLLQTRVSLETLKSQLLDIKKMKTDMLTALKNTAGLPFEKEIRLSRKLSESQTTAGVGEASPGIDIAVLAGKAAAEREDFKILDLQIGILEKTRAIVSKSKLPLVTASVNAELGNGIMPDVERLRTNWNAGIAVIYRIFDRSDARFKKEALDHDLLAVRLNIGKLQRNTQANLEKLFANLEILEAKLKIEEERLAIAKKSLELARRSFKESQATYLDVLNAQANYNLAENSLIALKYGTYITRAQIDFESGRATPTPAQATTPTAAQGIENSTSNIQQEE